MATTIDTLSFDYVVYSTGYTDRVDIEDLEDNGMVPLCNVYSPIWNPDQRHNREVISPDQQAKGLSTVYHVQYPLLPGKWKETADTLIDKLIEKMGRVVSGVYYANIEKAGCLFEGVEPLIEENYCGCLSLSPSSITTIDADRVFVMSYDTESG